MRDTPPDEERGVADATSRHARLIFVHDDFAYGKEFLGGERLGEEVRDIFVQFNEVNDYLVVLDEPLGSRTLFCRNVSCGCGARDCTRCQ